MKTRDEAYHTEELVVMLTPREIDLLLDSREACLNEKLEDKLAQAYEDWEYDYKK